MPIEAEPGTDSSQGSSKGPKEKGQRVFGGTWDYTSNCGENLLQQTRVHIHRNESLQSSIRMLLKEGVY